MMSESFGAVVGPVGFLDVGIMYIKRPRSQQLNALRRHFYDKFVRKLTRSDKWVVADSEDVHGGLEQVN
jgi:hypothetical protein